jgi:hypothetical protein
MSPTELNRADLWATGLSPDSYPTQLLRPQLEALGVVLAADLERLADGAAVTIGGLVTHRQRPMTAKGVVFVNLEDETGLVNVIGRLPAFWYGESWKKPMVPSTSWPPGSKPSRCWPGPRTCALATSIDAWDRRRHDRCAI